MKKVLYAIVFSFSALLGCSGNHEIETELEIGGIEEENQTENSTEDSMEDSTEVYQEYLGEKLTPIREYVAFIDSINEWPMLKTQVIELNGQKATATYYLSVELEKISVINHDESTKGESQYYFKNDHLVYCYEQEVKKLGEDEPILVENKSFFENETLFRSINNQDCGSPFNEEYREEEQKRIMGDLDGIRAAFQQN